MNGAVRYQFATQRPGARVPLVVLRDGRQVTLTANAEAPPGGAPDPRLNSRGVIRSRALAS
jgi:S1-C subfamily serine protease